MSILIKNADILSSGSLTENTNIFIEGSRISYIGDRNDFEADTVINGRHRVVMPGLINAHTHSSMTLFRSYADGLPLEQWLYTKIFPAEDKLAGEDVYNASALAILEMLSTGTTAFCDMYFFIEDIAKAVEQTGIRAKICRGLTNSSKSGFESDERIKENIDFFNKHHNTCGGRITVGFGMHSVYTCTPEYLKYCAGAVKELGAMSHVHLSETETENKNCIAAYGKTPAEIMLEAGVFDTPCIAAHCVHLSEEEMDILKSKGVTVAFNPTSNLKLKSGTADIDKMAQKGLNIALGTDGASSNNNLNMFEEMHIGALVSGLGSEQLLSMATVNGARALGIEDLGKIEQGATADMILVDTDKPHFYPDHDIAANMIYSAQGADVETTIVDGKILYDKGEYKTADFEKIKYNVTKSMERLCY